MQNILFHFLLSLKSELYLSKKLTLKISIKFPELSEIIRALPYNLKRKKKPPCIIAVSTEEERSLLLLLPDPQTILIYVYVSYVYVSMLHQVSAETLSALKAKRHQIQISLFFELHWGNFLRDLDCAKGTS